MDVVLLSRIQFALTIGFHYIFPPVSIGLALVLVIMEGLFLKTQNPLYRQMVHFWVRIFALIFSLGVASGIVMEFEFGTNWANYSRFVGDVFGSPLAAEGMFAFFLESTFLGILLFGWNRVGPKMHFFSTLMVALGSTMSAFWIIVANSWMQTPAGYHVVTEGSHRRAEITDFWAMVFNPSSMDRFTHTMVGAWQAGAWLVVSVGAYYLLRKRHEAFSKASIKIGLVIALVSSVLQLTTGHTSAIGVSKNQPAKLAAFEGHYEKKAPAPLYLFGWVDEANERVRFGLGFPGMLGVLISGDPKMQIQGLRAFPQEDRPPVQIVFQTYHLMVMIGMGLIGLSLLGVFLWWRGALFQSKWMLYLLTIAFLGPQIANQVGWVAAEVGRQPWIVYGLLRTYEGVSPVVSSAEVLASILMFSFIYLILFVLFIYLMIRKIEKGPEEAMREGVPASY
ncbi:MAG: cytochrome ubiquinol oxidase subunit I [Candidatus Omnitrophica bacterium]|nr:cytochrome ubiquinol oxidase subunit I [Candidatus Omnitrophota bacterium]